MSIGKAIVFSLKHNSLDLGRGAGGIEPVVEDANDIGDVSGV